MGSTNNNRNKWLDIGYELFAAAGPQALNVERLASLVGLNRSSFYHYFGDLDMYERELLEKHVRRFELLGEELDYCNAFDPDLLHMVKEHQMEVKFHRQLLINEATQRYFDCFTKSKSFTEQKIFQLWSTFNELGDYPDTEISLFETVRDYSLIHFEQGKDERVNSMLRDVKLLMFLKNDFDHDKLNV